MSWSHLSHFLHTKFNISIQVPCLSFWWNHFAYHFCWYLWTCLYAVQSFVLLSEYFIQWRIHERPLPLPKFFSISCSFSENLAKSYVGDPPPPGGWDAPSYGESSIRHWRDLRIWTLHLSKWYMGNNNISSFWLPFCYHLYQKLNYWLWNFQRYPKTLVSLSCHKIVDGRFF